MMYFKQTPRLILDRQTNKVCECSTVPSSKPHHRFKSNKNHMEVCM